FLPIQPPNMIGKDGGERLADSKLHSSDTTYDTWSWGQIAGGVIVALVISYFLASCIRNACRSKQNAAKPRDQPSSDPAVLDDHDHQSDGEERGERGE
ncbi:hypothetical protein PENTCL1PPCAC_27863, partial [Pristionchus entomophagus]